MDMLRKLEEKSIPEPNSGCWLWTAAVSSDGYGAVWDGKRTRSAHQVSYELHKGLVPHDMEIDHLCFTPSCINPAHLEAVSHRENVLRGRGLTASFARQTHCLWGHPFSQENTYLTPDGRRQCRSCINAAQQRYQARKRNQA